MGLGDSCFGKLKYYQDEDSCGRIDRDSQKIVVEVTDAGGGPYLVLRTDRWALDERNLEGFIDTLRRVLAAAQPQPEESCEEQKKVLDCK